MTAEVSIEEKYSVFSLQQEVGNLVNTFPTLSCNWIQRKASLKQDPI